MLELEKDPVGDNIVAIIWGIGMLVLVGICIFAIMSNWTTVSECDGTIVRGIFKLECID